MKIFEELKKLAKEVGANYTDEELMKAISEEGSVQCDLLPNWNIRKDRTCLREVRCSIEGKTKDIRCALRLMKIAGELRKKYWLEEVMRP